MRIRMQSNVPDSWVIGAIVLAGAAIVLAISALRLGAVDARPANPVYAPTVAPTNLTTAAPATAAPANSPTIVDPSGAPAPASPLQTLGPALSPLPSQAGGRGGKVPDLPPPAYRLGDQN